LAQLVINRQRAKSDYVAGSKQVQDADAQYFNMKMQIKQQLEAIIDDLQHQNASTQKAIDETDRRIAEIKKASINLSGSAVEMERLALEQKLVRDNYSLYSAKREEARINEEKDKRLFANVTIASHPQVPVTPWFPQRGRIMMLSIPLALMLALAFSASSYAMEQRLWTPTDISMRTNLRYLGSLDSVGIVEKTFGSLNFLRWTKGDRSS
jgi:uncharacterized protein involved in exopolysaccharide biosynthesis